MNNTSTPSITEGQTTKYRRLLEDSIKHAGDLALRKTGADTDGWQRVLRRGNELEDAIAEVVVAKTRELSCLGRYANEVVDSSYCYPREYKGPKPITDQIQTLAQILGLNPDQALEYAQRLPDLRSFVPEDALPWTNWFAVAYDEALARKYFPEVIDPTEKYCRAVQFILDKLADARSFYNYRNGQITKDHLRLCERTAQMMSVIAETQKKSEILLVAAQLGMRYRGHSTRLARNMFVGNEFGLEPLAGGSIALLHPERFVRFDELDLDLSGAEFSPDADGRFSSAPCLGYCGDRLGFGALGVGGPDGAVGSGSVFSPAVILES